MVSRYDNIILNVVCRAMAPFIILFALYVVIHGHYSPGGGFQGGAILAAGAMMFRLVLGKKRTSVALPPGLAPVLGALGPAIYGTVGLVAVFGGGNFLDYSFLPIPGADAPYLRYLGILFVELGVALGVFGLLLYIFDHLAGE